MNDKLSSFFQRTGNVFLLCLCATLLWGSAYPAVKLGYGAFRLDIGSPACLMAFAGTRFFLAGWAVLAVWSILHRRLPRIPRSALPGIVSLALVQTAGQYLFSYVGLAHTSGVRASILNSASTFLTVLLSALVWRREESMTARKWLGCAMGLIGVGLVNAGGSLGSERVTLAGEGALLVSALFVALGAIFSRRFTQGEDPFLITGAQLVLGGGVLLGAGLAAGGTLGTLTPQGGALMGYMVFISAVAFTLWTFLLKYNPVGRIAVFSFLTPIFGALLSSLFLSEQLLSPLTLLALGLAAGGIVVVNG
jgi:drug/metabolite transporter (DMT)-like permease